MNKTIKLLMIGNSFSEDASRFVHDISSLNSVTIETYNVVYPGCTLEQHYEFYKDNLVNYIYIVNGVKQIEKVSLKEILEARKYDYISFQQGSFLSGKKDTFYPYIKELINIVRAYQKDAKLLMHETWPYVDGSHHPAFPEYKSSSKYMADCIRKAYEEVSKENNLEIVKVMEDILKARELYNDSFSRDTFHLSTKGRYLASLRWVKYLTNDINNIFDPNNLKEEETGPFPSLEEIKNYINDIIK